MLNQIINNMLNVIISVDLLLSFLAVSVKAMNPMFTNISPTTIWNVNEDASVNYVIGTVAATDRDGDVPLVFAVSNTAGGPFAIDPTYGSLRINAANTLNYRSTRAYPVTLRVTDSRSEYSEVTITVKVNDVNEPPVITVNDVDLTIKEEASVGTIIPFQFSASDPNAGTFLSYFLIGGDTSIFNIDQSTGEITLNTKVDVDPSPNNIYRPVLKVSDGVLSATTTLTLTIEDINDHAPVCTPVIIYRSVREGTSGTLYSITCADGDSGFNGNNVLTYSISEGDSSKFSVSHSGVLNVTNAFDYETTPTTVLNVKVEDNASAGVKMATTATIIVSVTPLNDNDPIWSPSMSTNFTVSENIGVGMTIFTMRATDVDVDVGGTITYSITSVFDGSDQVVGLFNVDPSTGEVTTLTKLDADNGITQYIFDIRATDGGYGSHVITKTITVRLRDVNDNKPVFFGTPYAGVTVSEANAKTGSVVRTVLAIDNDATLTSLIYSVEAVIQGNTDVSEWRFSTVSPGQLEFAADIDLDSGKSATSVLKLIAKDSGTPALTGTATLTVSIISDNEFTPAIVSQPGDRVVLIAENRPIGSLVAEVIATDDDLGNEGVLSYSITGGDSETSFSINSNGKITTMVVLDKETMTDFYQLSVKVQDSGVNRKSVTTTVTVSVTDVNDHQPSCTFVYKTVSLPESTQQDSVVTTIPCSDADPDDILTISVRAPHDSVFGFSRQSNELKLLQVLDYDSAIQFYDVDVAVSDGVTSQTVKVRVNVGAVNEATPTFNTDPIVFVTENVLLNPVLIYTAADTDYSPHNIVSYVIRSVTNGGSSMFYIDSSSGEISLRTALDYDSLPAADKTFRLEVVAVDGGGLRGTGTVTVIITDINDNSPACIQSVFVVNMNEKQVGPPPFTAVANLGCSDVENGTSLTYSLYQTPGLHFTVNSDRVELTADTLDYETATSHTLVIKVTDLGIPVKTTQVIVYVNVINTNEGGPVFQAVTPVSIDETIGAAQSITDIAATDPDGSDSVFGDLQYSIISGNILNHFSIDATGRISTRKTLDYETTPSYNLVVLVCAAHSAHMENTLLKQTHFNFRESTDPFHFDQAKERGGTNSATVTQIINLNDINDEYPVCYQRIFSQTVAEDKPADHVVVDFSCSDKDAATMLTYTIINGNTNLFKMDGNLLKLKGQLDYDTHQSHDLTVMVSDSLPSHNVIITGTINVGSVNEGPPIFFTNPYMVSVNEAQAVSSAILTVLANDPDSTTDVNGQVKYSFISNYAHFVIDQNNGQILLAQKLDRETTAEYVLIVKAADALSFNTATVSVKVLDSNDNTPKFTSTSYSGTIHESAIAGTSILTVTATDLDDPDTNNYGTVTYALSGTSNFAITSVTGVITNTAPLIASTGMNSYLLTVTATDSRGLPGAHTASVLVTITVTTVNQNDPIFNPVSTSVTITESQYTVGDIITSVTVHDADSGANGDFDLSFVSPQNKFSLNQNGNVGQIMLAQRLDFDSGDTVFTLEMKAVDHGTISRSSTGTVVIIVNDANDNAPLCPRVINVDRVEGEINIATLTCSDADPGTTLFYVLVSTTPSTISPMVSATGVVTVNSPLDYERSTFHTIIIKVLDNGTPIKSTSVTVRLHIIDLNDNDPTLTGSFAFTISESEMPSNSVLYKAQANGNDGPTDFITYSLLDQTYFDILSTTGDITLTTNAPDYETQGGSYTMDVCAVDTANPIARTACHTIVVTITDVNDMRPIFDQAIYSAAVPENLPVGSPVLPVRATDADRSPAYRTIVYSLVTGAVGDWSISNTGTITSIAALDYETKTSYKLVVQASDGHHNVTVSCNIYITSVNEFNPVFTSAAETIAVAEDVALGTTLAIFAKAADGDGGLDGVLTYFIDAGPFIINSITGAIVVSSTLDRELVESYSLKVEAVDKGTIPRTGTLALTVNIEDVNDNAPVCSSNMYSSSVSESIAIGTSLASLLCQDDDNDPANLNNALAYSIVSGDVSFFSVDTLGVVRNTAVFDRETKSSYHLAVVISDKSAVKKLTFNATVSITIQDVNDNPPVFTSLPFIQLDEDTSVGTRVGTVSAVDADSGANGKLQFQITNGNPANTFLIDPITGHIILQEKLDYETQPRIYNLEIITMDSGSPVLSSVGTVTFTVVDANDNPPACAMSLYTATVSENTVNTLITTVTCTDIDTIGNISYSITSGNTNADFVIDPAAGSIRTSNNAAINYELIQSYTLKIMAYDGVHATTTTLKIIVTDVNEFSPQFLPIGPYSVIVPENVALGYIVITVNVTDFDTFDTVRMYSIIGGNGDGKFMIDSVSGQVKVQEILDYEAVQSYQLTLQVEDSGGLVGTAVLGVTITDINDNSPVCAEMSVVVNIKESVTAGSIYVPTCSDADTSASPTLGYTFVSEIHTVIGINSTTGELYLTGALDYEVAASHDMSVQVTDKAISPRITVFNITVNVIPINEYSPHFTPSSSYGTYFVSENIAIGTSIAQLTATDRDKGLRHGVPRYYIMTGDPQQQFSIDEMTGQIKVIRTLDQEARTNYYLTVRAVDDEPGSASQKSADATVSIDVTDENDNVPVFSPGFYTVSVLESSPYGPEVVLQMLTVRDDDMGDNSAMTISIIGGNIENTFLVSGNNLILSAQLDFETTTYYELVLEVVDGGKPTLKSAGRVAVNVLPFNENAPLMTTPNSVQTIPEDIPVGTLVFDANATDSDAGIDGHVTYSIVSGVTAYEFILNPTTGQLYVGSQLDYDIPPITYSIVICATDGSGLTDAFTSTVSLSIILHDVNDHIPQFAQTLFIFSVNENVAQGTSVGTVIASDKDAGVNGDIRYTKIGGSGYNYFNIDSTTGLLTTAAALDYEIFQTLYVSVQAQDGGTPGYISNGLVKIQINNMNDNDPMIIPHDFTVLISEDTAMGSNVFIYTASDKDTAINGYHLARVSSYFQVDASTGAVSTKALLDREKIVKHILSIQVLDLATSQDPMVRTFTATLTVIIEDINDNDPVISGTFKPSVPEDSRINTLVCTITASDADVDQNAQLTYSIIAGNNGGAFRVDSVGNVRVAAPLDRENLASYTLTILVSDRGIPSRSDQIDVTVTVDDVNDNNPVFTQDSYTFSVPENSNVGTSVGTLAATDVDNGVNGSLTYSIDSYLTGPVTHFTISAAVGTLTVAFPRIDREALASYVVRIKVTDAGTPFTRTAFKDVTIYIDDLNDNPPVFDSASYHCSIEENSPATSSVLRVMTSDADVGTNAAVAYSIDTNLADGLAADMYFKVDTNTGIISPKISIDYEIHKIFKFAVRAVDGGSPALTGTATVTVNIADVNDNNPIFFPDFYNTEIAYGGQCQKVITVVTAKDADFGSNGLISYSLETTMYNYLFAVDSSSGQLILSSVAAVNNMYSLEIQASDTGIPKLKAVTAARVRVDTYMPNDHVVTFRLKISRAHFVARQAEFIASLQIVVRRVYYSALVRLYCIEEYEGVVEMPSIGRRRLLAESPVDVHMYVLRDDSSNLISNMNDKKQFLTQDQFLTMVTHNPEGEPGQNIQGAEWDYYRISRVRQYFEKTEKWLETTYGIAITFLACLLGLFFLALVTAFIIRYCCGRAGLKRPPVKKNHIVDVAPRVEAGAKQQVKNQAWDAYEKDVTDEGGQPYRKAFPPMLITDPESPHLSTNRSTPLNNLNTTVYAESLSPVMTADGGDSKFDYNFNNNSRQFNGKVYNPEFGKLYEYDTKTNTRRFIL